MEKRIVQFVRALRAGGVRVSLAESAEAFQATELMGIPDRESFRLGLRSTLVKQVSDFPRFETSSTSSSVEAPPRPLRMRSTI